MDTRRLYHGVAYFYLQNLIIYNVFNIFFSMTVCFYFKSIGRFLLIPKFFRSWFILLVVNTEVSQLFFL